MTPETKAAFDNIVDTMTCCDGGKKFFRFKTSIEHFDQLVEDQAEGHHAAGKIIDVMLRFSTLLDSVNEKPKTTFIQRNEG